MAKHETRMARPHDYLMRATAAHARLAEGQPHADDAHDGNADLAEPSPSQRRARAQRRTRGGTFA